MVAKRTSRLPPRFDEVDQIILQRLRKNGRESHASLARATGLSVTACKARIHRLENEKIIEGYAAVIRTERRLATARKYVLVELESTAQKVRQTLELYLLARNDVISVELVEGDIDYVVRLEEYFPESHLSLLEDLSRIPGVRRTRTISIVGKLGEAAHESGASGMKPPSSQNGA